MANDGAAAKLHIAMFPWLAFGHVIPFLELSKLLAQKGHQISYISTPRNISRLPKLPLNLSSSINFVNLPLPSVQNFPEKAEASSDLPVNKIRYLKVAFAFDALQNPLFNFLKTSNPDWITYDCAPHWLPPISKNLGISNAYFSTFTPPTLCLVDPTSSALAGFYGNRLTPDEFTVQPDWIPFSSPLKYRMFEINRIFAEAVAEDTESETSDISYITRLSGVISGCDAIFIRQIREFEPEYLNVLEEIHGKSVIPVGGCLLPPTGDKTESWRSIKEWLDKQEIGSVVYIAFRSEAQQRQEELTEIAFGLELSELPFFWVLRTRVGSVDSEPIKLPVGFEDRTKGRGWVCTSWAPQLSILSHDSVGGCFIHGGWSSVVEAVMNENLLILLTLMADQGLNARILEANEMGYSIPRDENDGSFTREAVAAALRLVMVAEDGKVYRDKAKEMKGLFGNRDLQNRYLDNFVRYLKSRLTKMMVTLRIIRDYN